MALMSDKGVHCSDPYCRQCDFLPFTCDGCGKIFCKDHFRCEEHNCPAAKAKDRRVVVCALCGKAVPHGHGEEANAVLERHIESGDCRPTTAASASKPRCPARGCKEKLTSINSFQCGPCGQRVCMKHRFEDQHDCKRPGPLGRRHGAAACAQQAIKPFGLPLAFARLQQLVK